MFEFDLRGICIEKGNEGDLEVEVGLRVYYRWKECLLRGASRSLANMNGCFNVTFCLFGTGHEVYVDVYGLYCLSYTVT